MTDQNTNKPQTEPPQVTTDIVASGIVKGYFKLVAILLCIGVGAAILWGVIYAIGSGVEGASKHNADDSFKAIEADYDAHPHKRLEDHMDWNIGVSELDTACDGYRTYLCVDKKTAKDAKRLEHLYRNAKDAQKSNLSADVQQKAIQLVIPAEKEYDDDVLASAAREKQRQVDADAKAKKQLQTDIEKGQ